VNCSNCIHNSNTASREPNRKLPNRPIGGAHLLDIRNNKPTLPKMNIVFENQWFRKWNFHLGWPMFKGKLLVSGECDPVNSWRCWLKIVPKFQEQKRTLHLCRFSSFEAGITETPCCRAQFRTTFPQDINQVESWKGTLLFGIILPTVHPLELPVGGPLPKA